MAEDEGMPLPVNQVIQNRESVGKVELKNLDQKIPAMQQVLNIVANAMCYLTAYPDDIDLDWAINTPKDMIAKASKGNPTIKKNTKSKLLSLGYRKINICGRALKQGSFNGILAKDNRTVKTHWRKGFWKRQPYGLENSLRKMILIKPLIVNPGDGLKEDLPDTIYISENIINLKVKKV